MANQADFTIDNKDLLELFNVVQFAYNGISFENFVGEIIYSYIIYFNVKQDKTFSEWVKGQIEAVDEYKS